MYQSNFCNCDVIRHPCMLAPALRADLHGTIFVACDKRTIGLRHVLRLSQHFKTCCQMHATKIVPCKSVL